MSALSAAGLSPFRPDGSYFILADTREAAAHMPPGLALDARPDYNVCKWLTAHVGVAAIPPSAFYSEAHKGDAAHLARFCYCKTDEDLKEAAKRLARIKQM